jgi:ribonuclease VapC
MQKCLASGVDVNGLREDFQALGLEILPLTPQQAETAARLWQQTWPYGLSLGDCVCFGVEMKTPVLTADHAWLDLNLAVEVRAVR